MPKQHQAVDMTQGDPLGLLVRFSLPLLAGNAFQQLYNMVDSWVVGNFVGTTALAAVGIGFPVIYLLSSLFMGLSIGGSVVIAQFMGAGDREAVRRSVNTVYGAVMVSVVPLTLFGVLIAGPILHLIRVPADVYDQAHVYLQVIFAGIIGSLGYNINAGILQGLGDSKTPLLFLATACVVNIVLDLVFVLVFDWGVFGVAFATIIAQLCSWIFGVCYVNRKYDFIAIRPLHISVDNVLLKRVLKLGVPSGIQQCQFSVAILVLQALINGFGAEFAAGFSAANKVDTFAFMPVDSFCLAVTTYVGQNVGAGRLDRVREGVRKAILLCVGVCLVMSVLVVLNAERLIMLFNTDPLVVASGRAYLLRVVSPMFPNGHYVSHQQCASGCGSGHRPHALLRRGAMGGQGAGGISAGPFFRPGGALLVLLHWVGPWRDHQRYGLPAGQVEGAVCGARPGYGGHPVKSGA